MLFRLLIMGLKVIIFLITDDFIVFEIFYTFEQSFNNMKKYILIFLTLVLFNSCGLLKNDDCNSCPNFSNSETKGVESNS